MSVWSLRFYIRVKNLFTLNCSHLGKSNNSAKEDGKLFASSLQPMLYEIEN